MAIFGFAQCLALGHFTLGQGGYSARLRKDPTASFVFFPLIDVLLQLKIVPHARAENGFLESLPHAGSHPPPDSSSSSQFSEISWRCTLRNATFPQGHCQWAPVPLEWNWPKPGAIKPDGAAPSRTTSLSSSSTEEGPTTAFVLVEGSLQALLDHYLATAHQQLGPWLLSLLWAEF